MNNVRKILLLVLTLLLVLVPSALAQDDTADTVPDYVEADSRLDTLAAAIMESGLYQRLTDGEWTLFAPTDEAFAELGLNPENVATELSVEELLDLLRYHLLPEEFSTAELKAKLGNVDMGNGALAGLSFYEDEFFLNDLAKVIEENIVVGNGTIHVVDSVIQGPWPKVEEAAPPATVTAQAAVADEDSIVIAGPAEGVVGGPAETPVGAAVDAPVPSVIPPNSIAGKAVADGRFTTLIAAAVASDLVDDFASGEWTAFVPTNEAFAKLGLTANNIATQYSQEELADLLLYHVMKGSKSTAELKGMLGNVTMANGQQAGLKYYEDHLYVNDDSKVIQENIVTDNGTIHVVDNVILPPWPRE